MKLLYISIILFFVTLASCNKEDSKEVATSKPQVTKVFADKDTINYGGTDPCTITVEATGGNLSYKWYVDLGNIVPLNSNSSKIRFTGSECCLGDKYITCTVSNELGKIDTTKIIFIRDPQK